MSYYQNKIDAAQSIQDLIIKNPGQTIYLADIEIPFSMKYGFGKNTILKLLKPYEEKGTIKIRGDFFEVRK